MIFGLMGYQDGEAGVANSFGFMNAGWGHFGDIFNFYKRYIDQFLSSLRSQIGDAP